MKLAIVSDIHFGDPSCTMVSFDETSRKFVLGAKYNDFYSAAGKDNDYLILLGDIFDFSISTYQETYSAAQVFFQQLARDQITKEIIYVPGNHDFAAWHIFMHEVNVINRIKEYRPLAEDRWSCPAVLKDGPNPRDWLTLPYVTSKPEPGPKYGGVFLEYLTRPDSNAKPIPFNVAYPNIYLVTNEGEGVLLTHGQYLEPYWALAGESAKEIVGSDLKLRHPDALEVDELVSINFPLNELASSGIGQAAPLTKILRTVQDEVKSHQLNRTERYLNNFKQYVDRLLKFGVIKEWLSDFLLKAVFKNIINALENYKDTRYNTDLLKDKAAYERFVRFYTASMLEVDLLNRNYNCGIPVLSTILCGHTHDPYLVQSNLQIPIPDRGISVKFMNTGGWLKPTTIETHGVPLEQFRAAVFNYAPVTGFQSTLV